MHIVRFAQAPGYTAAGHHDMTMVCLQGREAGPSSDLWIGVSVIVPGGGTTLSSSPQEKMYVALDGTLHVSNGEDEVALGPNRSLRERQPRPSTDKVCLRQELSDIHPELCIVIRCIGIGAEANQAQGNCDGRGDVSVSLAPLVCEPR